MQRKRLKKPVSRRKQKDKAVETATAARKTTPRERASKGDTFECEVCGLSVIVDEESGAAEYNEVLCCGKPMAARTSRVK